MLSFSTCPDSIGKSRLAGLSEAACPDLSGRSRLSAEKADKAGTRTIILYVCLIFLFFFDFALGDSPVQSNWRWRNDDGDVYTATWKDSLNTPVVLTDYENIRLRIESINDFYPETSIISLRYTEDVFNNEVWTQINGLDTGKFFIAPSIYLSDQESFFDNQLLAHWNQNLKYQKTITFDSTNNYLFLKRGENSSLYEWEYSIKPTLKIEPGSAYFFSLFEDSIPMGANEYAVIMTPPINWVSQSFETEYTFYGLGDIFFIDANTGFAVGDVYKGDKYCAQILKTTDGGESWIELSCPTNVGYLNAVCFVNTDIGTAVGDSGVILRTTNGGTTWVKQNSNITSFISDVCFINADSGTAISGEWINNVTYIGYILRTTNGGTTWTKQSYPNKHLNEVCYTDLNTGTIVGMDRFSDSEVLILRTTNGGESWFNQSSGITGSLGGVFFNDEKYGFAAGGEWESGSVILKTTNGGDNWTKVLYEPGPFLYSVQFIDKNTGWATGEFGRILKTTDGGLSWKKLTSGTSQDLGTVQFVNSEIGWAVGGNKILKTTNGGITTFIEEEKTDFIPEGFYLSQNYPNPFNPTTSIEYRVVSNEYVTLKIYDVLGNEVATLVNEEKPAGSYEVTWNAEGLASGVYFYQLKAGSFTETKKLILLR